MADLDVSLRLRLVNMLSGPAKVAEKDLQRLLKTTGKRVGNRSSDRYAKDIERVGRAAKGASRDVEKLGTASAKMRDAQGRFVAAATGARRLGDEAGRAARQMDRLAQATRRVKSPPAPGAGGRGRFAGSGGAAAGNEQSATGRQGEKKPHEKGATEGGGIMGAIGDFVVGAASAVSGAALVKKFAGLETVEKRIEVTAAKPAEAVKAYTKAYQGMTSTFGVSARQISEAAEQFVVAGVEFDEAMKSAPIAVKAAKAAFAEIPDVASAGISVVGNMKVRSDQLKQAFDAMAYAGKKGRVELKDMAKEFPALTGRADALGMTGLKGVADISAGLQIVRKVTASGEEASNRLQNFYDKIFQPETIGNFKDKGVNLEKEIKAGLAKGVSAVDTTLRLVDKLTKGDKFKIGELFGDVQANEAVSALLKYRKEYEDLRADITKNAAGTLDTDFKTAIDRVEGDFERLQTAAGRVGDRLGEGLSLVARPAMQGLVDVFDKLEKRLTTTGLDRFANRMRVDREVEAEQKTIDQGADARAKPAELRARAKQLREAAPGKGRSQAARSLADADRLEARASEIEAAMAPVIAEYDKQAQAIHLRREKLQQALDMTAAAVRTAHNFGFGEGGSKGGDSTTGGGIIGGANAFPMVAGSLEKVGTAATGVQKALDAAAKAAGTLEGELGQDLSGAAEKSMGGFNAALKAQGDQAIQTAQRIKQQLESILGSISATPTIAPRLSLPSSGGGASGGAGKRADAGGRAGGRGGITIAKVEISGVRDMASLERQLTAAADRKARQSFSGALHDTA